MALRDVIDNSQIPLFPDAGLKFRNFYLSKFLNIFSFLGELSGVTSLGLAAIKRQTIVLNTNLLRETNLYLLLALAYQVFARNRSRAL